MGAAGTGGAASLAWRCPEVPRRFRPGGQVRSAHVTGGLPSLRTKSRCS